MQLASNEKTYIKNVVIEGLFGYYDYNFEDLTIDSDYENFITLHGNNGSGKTTILNIIASLLSSRDMDFTKTYLANTKFSLCEIHLSTGVVVRAVRSTEDGDFDLQLEDNKGITFFEMYFSTTIGKNKSTKYSPKISEEQKVQYGEFQELLSQMGINTSLISHKRKIINFFGEISEGEEYLYDPRPEREHADARLTDVDRLLNSLASVEEWLDQEIRDGSNIGLKNSNMIYFNLIKVLKSVDEFSIGELMTEMQSVVERMEPLSKYGIMPDIQVEPFIKEVLNLSQESQLSKASLVTVYYYFKSITEKLDALEPVFGVIDSFISIVNDFFQDKKLIYTAKSGFDIKFKSGRRIEFSDLSSGETQLLLILLNALKSNIKGEANIILIDEPEISLDITWQRKLLNSFEAIAGHSPIQFILATHSIELISESYDNVVNLSKYHG